MRRVVITGLGAVTPIGNNVKDFWTSLVNGVSGIDVIKRFDPIAIGLPVIIAGEVKNLNPENFLDSKELKRMSDFVKFAVIAAKEAIEDSGLDLDKIDLTRAGVIVGTGIGGLGT